MAKGIIKNFATATACVLAVIGMGSCSSSKEPLPYFQNLSSGEGILTQGNYEIKIEPDDELAISVMSTVPEATAVYNLPLHNPATLSSIPLASQSQQLTYLVDEQGYIKMPVLGKVKAEGLTTNQLEEQLVTLISRDVRDPIVKVSLVNFKVQVIGEVLHPGTIQVKSQRVSVFDALAAAGDLTPYGKRSNVLLIREEDGAKSYHRINLNDASVLESPYYYLKQNDIIYVEPNSIRQDNSKYNTNNAYKISVISTIVSASSVIASLVIALVVKSK